MKVKHVWIAIVSLGILCALMLPAPAMVVATENLASNGDFELGNTSGWEVGNGSIETATVYDGSYSLKLTATSAYGEAALKTIPVRSNATITVSFYYRYASTPTGAYHVYTYQGAGTSGGPYSNADKSFSVPSGCNGIATWKQASYTFNSGNNTAITLKFCPEGNGCNVACYIDNLVVTSEGGDETEMDPYLTSYGTKHNRPKDAASNLIAQGGFETFIGATWNTESFNKGHISLAEDATAPEGAYSLYYNNSTTTAVWHTFPVAVEKYTQYTFSAWVKAPRLSANNNATATFGVVNAETGDFLVYEPYDGNGYGTASLSTTKMQLMATSPDDEWHLRSVTFYSGSHDVVHIGVYGAKSQLYLDDIALYKSSNGVEYVSPLRTDVISDSANTGNKYCADEDSLIEGIYMTTNDAQLSWSDNPAWRNGFLSFENAGDSHGMVLKYTASSKTNLKLHYINWIEVTPHTDYTLTLDVKRLTTGGGRIALLDDNYSSPAEFYTISFTSVDSDWVTHSIHFNSESYSRIGFAIVDGGGSAYIDEVRLFESDKGVAIEPTEPSAEPQITLMPTAYGTAVMEMDSTTLGVAFRFRQEGWRIYRDSQHRVDLASAAVLPYGDGESYPLVRMGAVVTNDAAIGEDAERMTVSAVNGVTVCDVPVVYVNDVTETGCDFAVRVVNVPLSHADTLIFVRPYYVFEKDGVEILVYGDIAYRSYNG